MLERLRAAHGLGALGEEALLAHLDEHPCRLDGLRRVERRAVAAVHEVVEPSRCRQRPEDRAVDEEHVPVAGTDEDRDDPVPLDGGVIRHVLVERLRGRPPLAGVPDDVVEHQAHELAGDRHAVQGPAPEAAPVVVEAHAVQRAGSPAVVPAVLVPSVVKREEQAGRTASPIPFRPVPTWVTSGPSGLASADRMESREIVRGLCLADDLDGGVGGLELAVDLVQHGADPVHRLLVADGEDDRPRGRRSHASYEPRGRSVGARGVDGDGWAAATADD